MGRKFAGLFEAARGAPVAWQDSWSTSRIAVAIPGEAAVALSALGFATAGVIARTLFDEGISTFTVAALRVTGAGLVLALLLAAFRPCLLRPTRPRLDASAIGSWNSWGRMAKITPQPTAAVRKAQTCNVRPGTRRCRARPERRKASEEDCGEESRRQSPAVGAEPGGVVDAGQERCTRQAQGQRGQQAARGRTAVVGGLGQHHQDDAKVLQRDGLADGQVGDGEVRE